MFQKQGRNFSFEKEIGISKHNLSQCENCIGPFFYFLLQVLQAFSDALYASPGIFSAGTFARKSKNTYFYHFAHHSKMGPYGQVCCYDLRIFCLESVSKKKMTILISDGLDSICYYL